MPKYYHITKPENVEQILKEGLVAQVGENAASNGETDPFVFLCDEDSIPYWMVLLNESAILEIDGFKSTAIESHQYDGYLEYMSLDSVPAKYIRVSALKPDKENAMKDLCISFIYTICDFCAEIIYFYEQGIHDRLYVDDLIQEAERLIRLLNRLDYSVSNPEEIKQAIWDSGDGSYSFVSRYHNDYTDENSYIWKKIMNFKKDRLRPHLIKLSQAIQERFADYLYMDQLPKN